MPPIRPCWRGLSEADLAFVIDPVDGTLNFASGLPLFGVMLAVAGQGRDGCGHHPRSASARTSSWRCAEQAPISAMSTVGMEPVHVAPAAAVSAMTGAVSWHYAEEPERSMLARNLAKFNAHFNFRCAAHEYRLVASGNAHFLAYQKLMPWDHLPGVLIHAEAGGHSAYLDGEPYRPSRLDGGLLVAPDKASWQEIRRTLWDGVT